MRAFAQRFMVLALAALAQPCAAAEPARLAPGEHDAKLPDIQLHYTVAGQGPLLIVAGPGWGPGSLYLQRGLAPLSQHNTLLVFDPRGSGKSSRPADPAKMSGADMADDIEHLRLYLGQSTIRLLGHSDGGAIALDYAERYPASLSKLVIVDGTTHGQSKADQEEGVEEQRIMTRLSVNPRYRAAAAAMKSDPPPTDDQVFAKNLAHELPVYFADPDKNMAAFVATDAGPPPSSWALMAQGKADAAHDWHQEERLGQVKAASLVVVGKQDWICPVLIAQHIKAGIAGAQLVVIDGSGHFPWIEQPAVFFQAVGSFLAK